MAPATMLLAGLSWQRSSRAPSSSTVNHKSDDQICISTIKTGGKLCARVFEQRPHTVAHIYWTVTGNIYLRNRTSYTASVATSKQTVGHRNRSGAAGTLPLKQAIHTVQLAAVAAEYRKSGASWAIDMTAPPRTPNAAEARSLAGSEPGRASGAAFNKPV